jgi:hypothetical protein
MNGCFLAEQSAARSTEVVATIVIVIVASVSLETIAIDDRGEPAGADFRFGASRDRKHAAVTAPQAGATVCGREP